MPDERKGLPSASETERLALCRASFLRSKNQPDTSSGIAQTGTRIHEAVESGDRAGLTLDPPTTGDPRFELGLTDSESVVLPLHQSPLGQTRHHTRRPAVDSNCGAWLSPSTWLFKHHQLEWPRQLVWLVWLVWLGD